RCPEMQLNLLGGWREKFRDTPLLIELRACHIGPDDLAKQAEPHGGRRILVLHDLELLVGTVEIAGDAQEIGKKRSSLEVGWMLANLFVGKFDRVRQASFGQA